MEMRSNYFPVKISLGFIVYQWSIYSIGHLVEIKELHFSVEQAVNAMSSVADPKDFRRIRIAGTAPDPQF